MATPDRRHSELVVSIRYPVQGAGDVDVKRMAVSPSWLGGDLGVDLGTTNTLVYARGKGIVSSEPSAVALDRHTQQVIAVGAAAHAMLGKTPPGIVAVRPVQGGVVADYRAVEPLS